MASAPRPASASASRAPASRRSVTKSLKRATTTAMRTLASLPGGLALLQERLRAFLRVLGRGDSAEERGLEELSVGKRGVQTGVDCLDDVAGRKRRLRG